MSVNYEVLSVEDSKVPVKAWVKGVLFEAEAQKQLLNLSKMPFIFKHVSAMPDCHMGIGATVGSVIATKNAIIPAAVGVDIGCGMNAVKTTLRADQIGDLATLRHKIESAVPHGRTAQGGENDRGSWHDIPTEVEVAWMGMEGSYRAILDKHPKVSHKRPINQLGSMGTGNHFLEVCLDQDNAVWLMLHSGSRGVGNNIGQYFIEKAREDMRRYFINLPDQDLAYLPEGTEHFNDYMKAVSWAQNYARVNRELMMENAIKALKRSGEVPSFDLTETVISCHHNYVARENHFGENVYITRKGAVRAREGDMGIIPGSMGTKSYIVRGKGNPDSFMSCSHGAGRKMSRTKARATFTLKDHRAATEGVECRKDNDVLDETPGAYKDIDEVMKAQSDLVEVAYTLKQVLCIKG